MSKLIKLFVVLCIPIGCGIWLLHGKMAEDPGLTIPMAYGFPDEETIEVHAMVDIGMLRREGVRVNDRGDTLWNEWVEDHFDLRDASGERVPLTRISQSHLIPEHKVRGVPEFFLKMRLKRGEQYTLDYIPRRSQPAKYRRVFSVPMEETEVHRYAFTPPEETPQEEPS